MDEEVKTESTTQNPTPEQIQEAEKDPAKKVVEKKDGVHILERIRG